MCGKQHERVGHVHRICVDTAARGCYGRRNREGARPSVGGAWLAVRSPSSRTWRRMEDDGEMTAKPRRHREGRHVQQIARRTGAAASVDPEASDEQRIKAALNERVGALTRRHRCTAPRRCTEHSALIKQETGVSIDDLALREVAGRAVPVMLASHAELLAWEWDTAAYLNEVAKRLDAITEAAPDDANVPHVRDGWVAEVRGLAMKTGILARGFAEAHAAGSPSSALFVPGATPIDDLERAVRAVRTWVRQHSPTSRRPWHVVAAILVHHGWEITGATLAHQADSVRQLVRRRAV